MAGKQHSDEDVLKLLVKQYVRYSCHKITELLYVEG